MSSKEKHKCPMCNRRTNILDIKCKCGNVFCMTHRLPEDHKCTFNFKEFERERLQKNNNRDMSPKYIETIS